MTKKERLFVAKLLRMAEEEFGNHGCNDMPSNLQDHFTQDEWAELDKRYHQYNEHTDNPTESCHVNADFAWMAYFAYVLETEDPDVCLVCKGMGRVWKDNEYGECEAVDCSVCWGSGRRR